MTMWRRTLSFPLDMYVRSMMVPASWCAFVPGKCMYWRYSFLYRVIQRERVIFMVEWCVIERDS